MKASNLSMTSSFWFQGKLTEIDTVEQIGAPALHPERSDIMHMNTHHYDEGRKNHKKTPRSWEMPSGAAEEFHVYGVWWKDEKTIWFYHNGEKVTEVQPEDPFTQPMYMFFDTEVFTWEGLPTIASLNDPTSNTMAVDWVRAWQLEPVMTEVK